MIKNIIIILSLSLSINAFASENLDCESVDGQTFIEVNNIAIGNIQSEDNESLPMSRVAAATLIIKSFNGEPTHTLLALTGRTQDTMQGPYFNLDGNGGYQLYISAPISQDFSVLTTPEKEIGVICSDRR